MQKIAIYCFLILLMPVMSLISCKTPVTAPEAPLKVPAQGNLKEGTEKAAPSWEVKWADTLGKAKKEGVVSIYSLWPPENRTALLKAFKERYGIELEFTAFSRGAEMLAKVKAEERAGLSVADVFGTGETTILVILKPESVLSPIQPILILPEVLDPQVWRGGKIPFTDKETTSLSMMGIVQRTLIYNTGLIKEGEISSYKDLLKPQYKGKIAMNDPTLSGSGNAFMMHLGENLWGEAEASEFLRRLIKEQDLVISRDNRLHVEWVAQGKYPVGLAPNDIHYSFIEMGAPIRHALVKEDNRLTASTGGLAVAARPAHPNATTVFVNWLMSKEGQTVFARGAVPSMRLDVSTDSVNSILIPKAGEKYFINSEELVLARGKWLEIAQKVVAEAKK